MKLSVIFFALFLCLAASMPAAEIAPDKRAEIDRMLKLTGMENLMTQMKNQMLDAMKPQLSKLPPELVTKLSAKLDMSEFLEQIIGLYDKYYTLEDLRAVNAFYSSPAGQKILSTLPQIMQESMRLGQKWGETAARKAFEETKAEWEALQIKVPQGGGGDTPPAPAR